MCDFRRGHVTSECVSIAISCSLTDDAVFLIQSVDEGAGDQALVVDASQLGVAGTRDVHRAEGTIGKEEAVGIASGISVKTRNVSGVIDAEGDRAFGEWKGYGGEDAAPEHKAVGGRGAIRPRAHDIPGGVDPGGRRRGGPGEIDGRQNAATADEAVLDERSVEVGTDDLPGIVDANGLRSAPPAQTSTFQSVVVSIQSLVFTFQLSWSYRRLPRSRSNCD